MSNNKDCIKICFVLKSVLKALQFNVFSSICCRRNKNVEVTPKIYLNINCACRIVDIKHQFHVKENTKLINISWNCHNSWFDSCFVCSALLQNINDTNAAKIVIYLGTNCSNWDNQNRLWREQQQQQKKVNFSPVARLETGLPWHIQLWTDPMIVSVHLLLLQCLQNPFIDLHTHIWL